MSIGIALSRPVAAALLLWCLLPPWGLGCGAERETDRESSNGDLEAPGRRSRNVVLITLDTVRHDALGAYGQPLPSSPEIDAMAASGVVFERVASAAPSTTPSHATLFTGRFPFSHGVRANAGYRLPPENLTLAEVLQENGYVTAGEISAPVLMRSKRLDQGFDQYTEPADEVNPVYLLDEAHAHDEQGKRDAKEITDSGIAFLRRHRTEPFFLWLHYFDAHRPYNPPVHVERLLPGQPYLGEVRRIDEQLGRIREELVSLGLADRTLVVITADHGEGNGEHGETTHSYFVYESTMRIPLILWGGGVPRGLRVPTLVRSVDVAPTLLDWLDLPGLPDSQGVSLRPLLVGETDDLRLTGYGESIEPLAAFGSDVLRSVQVGKWKYIHKLEPELFDVEADPAERDNLAPSHPEIVARLRTEMAELIAEAERVQSADALAVVAEEERAQLQALGYAAAEAPAELSKPAESLELSGPDPTAHIALFEAGSRAWGLLASEDYEGAAREFEALYEAHPDGERALGGLITALVQLQRDDEVIPLLRHALEIEPEARTYRFMLAQRLRRKGEVEEPLRLYRELLELAPCHEGGRLHASELLRESARYREQLAILDSQDRAECPPSRIIDNALAYALATSPEDDLRDGPRALELAQRLVAEAKGERPDLLDTLACAHAELGQFDEALRVQKRAMAMLERYQLPDDVTAPLRRNLAAIEAGRPIREQ